MGARMAPIFNAFYRGRQIRRKKRKYGSYPIGLTMQNARKMAKLQITSYGDVAKPVGGEPHMSICINFFSLISFGLRAFEGLYRFHLKLWQMICKSCIENKKTTNPKNL